jgi:NADPH:quinone reductase-like Zn-dependent oxidoreductase
VKDFYPIDYIPSGVRLTSYGGNAVDLPRAVLQQQLDAIAAGTLKPSIHRVYDGLEEVRSAHRDMENNQAIGKLVVRVRHGERV